MIIRPICANRYQNGNVNSCKRTNFTSKSPAFKGNYVQVMEKVLNKNLTDRVDVANAMTSLYKALKGEKGAKIDSIDNLLSIWFLCKSTYLVEELCKPIAEVAPELRDIVFRTQKNNLTVLGKDDKNLVFIMNLGKHGFWNSVFERESARNDMKIVFASDRGTFEICTDSKGRLVAEQYFSTGYWKSNVFNKSSGTESP